MSIHKKILEHVKNRGKREGVGLKKTVKHVNEKSKSKDGGDENSGWILTGMQRKNKMLCWTNYTTKEGETAGDKLKDRNERLFTKTKCAA